MDSLKLALEKAWASHLTAAAALTGVQVVASDREGLVPEDYPYVVVTIADMQETTPRTNVYRVEMDFVLVSLIDEAVADEVTAPPGKVAHHEALQALKAAIDGVATHVKDEANNVQVMGWAQTATRPAKDDQHYGDVISLVMGASWLVAPV